jgi:hypothetical protein
MEKEERDALEKKLAHEAAWKTLSFHDLEDWKSCSYINKARAHSGKTFIVWKNTAAEPTILDVFKVQSIQVSFTDGLQATVADEWGEEYTVGHSPSRISSYKVYMHIPYTPELQYLPNASKTTKVLRFPLIVKQFGRPDSLAMNMTYLTDVPDFKRLFPQFIDRKF